MKRHVVDIGVVPFVVTGWMDAGDFVVYDVSIEGRVVTEFLNDKTLKFLQHACWEREIFQDAKAA